MRVSSLSTAALIGTFAGATLLSGVASAQCSNPQPGPDVIVGGIPNISNYGALGGMAAYSLGTTSCNTGTQELLWIANNTNHPVIGQNIFRLENGRFEQIGMSWLKHGFTALQQNLCCNCQSSGTGSRLGVGCSDPYGSSLNGSQGGLGPKSQVNAFTGAFSYPYMAQGQQGDRIYKRIQVLNDDVDPSLHPNAQYFGESQYIAPDDAAAGNGFNNASWVNLNRSGAMTQGAWRLDISGATNRERGAIYAWKVNEPTVTIQELNVPGEGQFVLGSNVVDNGDGTWNYEYAIFNNNSDFSAQAFSVGIGSSATVINEGSSFPMYHSGEPYTNAAWTPVQTNGVVTFATEPFAMNQNANALRWGTTYSFWFTSNAPPGQRPGSISLFKPGNPGDLNFLVDAPMDAMGGGAFVSNYCTAVVNSTGLAGSIAVSNVDTVGRTMDLNATKLPPNSFGFFIASMTQAFVPNAGGSSGNLCIGGQIGRGVAGGIQDSGALGEIGGVVDLDMVPTPTGTTPAVSGQTWYFQAWHRDSLIFVSTSNFTDGARVTFL